MKTYRALTLITAVLLVFSLAACERSFAPAKKAVPTTPPDQAVPAGPTQPIDQIYMFATQTALAQGPVNPTTGVVELTPAAPEAQATQAPQPTSIPAIIVAPTATPGLPATYVLQKGEFPYCIARRFNVNPAELLQLNGIGSAVQPGFELKIPQTGNPFPGSRSLKPHPTTYTVGAGETIYFIACLFGDVAPDAIAYVNGLVEPYTLTAGQTLQIP